MGYVNFDSSQILKWVLTINIDIIVFFLSHDFLCGGNWLPYVKMVLHFSYKHMTLFFFFCIPIMHVNMCWCHFISTHNYLILALAGNISNRWILHEQWYRTSSKLIFTTIYALLTSLHCKWVSANTGLLFFW